MYKSSKIMYVDNGKRGSGITSARSSGSSPHSGKRLLLLSCPLHSTPWVSLSVLSRVHGDLAYLRPLSATVISRNRAGAAAAVGHGGG